MKAWEVSVYKDSEKGMVIVWSENQSKAKTAAYALEADCFTDLRAVRCKWADNLSGLSEKAMIIEKLRNEWTFYDYYVENIKKYVAYLDSDDIYGIEKLGFDAYLEAKVLNNSYFLTPEGWKR